MEKRERKARTGCVKEIDRGEEGGVSTEKKEGGKKEVKGREEASGRREEGVNGRWKRRAEEKGRRGGRK